MIHQLKCWPEYFQAVKYELKKFEIRKEDDRIYTTGDFLDLHEWSPETESFTNEKPIRRVVTYVLRGQPFLPDGYVCMSLGFVSMKEGE